MLFRIRLVCRCLDGPWSFQDQHIMFLLKQIKFLKVLGYRAMSFICLQNAANVMQSITFVVWDTLSCISLVNPALSLINLKNFLAEVGFSLGNVVSNIHSIYHNWLLHEPLVELHLESYGKESRNVSDLQTYKQLISSIWRRMWICGYLWSSFLLQVASEQSNFLLWLFCNTKALELIKCYPIINKPEYRMQPVIAAIIYTNSELHNLYKIFVFWWKPLNVGIPGNEEADSANKHGICSQLNLSSVSKHDLHRLKNYIKYFSISETEHGRLVLPQR